MIAKHFTSLTFFLMLSMASHSIYAQLIPNFGGQRRGASTLSFLKNDMSPRSTALSGASVALNVDGYSIYNNPSAIADQENFTASISNYSLGAGIQQSFASVILPRKNKLSAFGFSLNMLNSGEMEVRTEFQPEGTGEKFFVTNLAAGLSYAAQLSDMFSAGVTLKYIYEQIEEFSNSTLAADVSFLYKTDFKQLKFAVMVQNFGGNSSINGGGLQVDFNRNQDNTFTEEYTVPTVFSLGASFVPWEEENQSLLVVLQLNHPNDNSENYRLGLEYQYRKLLYLRGGLKLNVKSQPFPTFGLGLRHRIGGHPLFIDYAVNPTEFLGTLHTIGLAFTMNKMERE